ncbi:MAG: cytochrome c biogenesis heme-transporting ATPase CcmA [Halieaceae bacterium]|jgi:heme exporter protein A|nr:cytochrome c biogenesis heme-transporting ATPase CcmA [Halieaceae bacterium]
MTDTAHSSPLLVADSLSLTRGGRELFRDLSFEINAGQLVQLEGSNGAGKTSLIRILVGLSRYGFDGTVTRPAPILYLGHLPGVKAMLSPRENLAWHASGEGTYSDTAIEQALQQVGLYGYEDVPSHALSAGQHRRVNLARLYLSSCPLWVLDEPFAAIDKSGVSALEAQLLQHVSCGGAVVMTSHQALQVDYTLEKLRLDGGIVS